MPADADTPVKAKGDILRVVWLESAIVVEEAFGKEFERSGVLRFVVRHGPVGEVQISAKSTGAWEKGVRPEVRDDEGT